MLNALLGTIKGVAAHAKCDDASKDRYHRLVTPIDCRRCLGLEPEEPPATDAPPEPPIPSRLDWCGGRSPTPRPWPAGRRPVGPKRPDKEVERIFHQHCKPCKWYDPERSKSAGDAAAESPRTASRTEQDQDGHRKLPSKPLVTPMPCDCPEDQPRPIPPAAATTSSIPAARCRASTDWWSTPSPTWK